MNIGDKILYVRKDKGLSSKLFAGSIDISPSALSQIEHGTTKPSTQTISNVCRVYNVNPDWLNGVDDSAPVYNEVTLDEEIAAFIGNIAGLPDGDFKKNFVHHLANMTDEGWRQFELFFKAINERK